MLPACSTMTSINHVVNGGICYLLCITRLILSLHRNIDIKPRPFVYFTRCRYNAIVVVNNFFYNSKPYASAGIFFFAMQALKQFEDPVAVLRIEANAIIGKTDMTVSFFRSKPVCQQGRSFDVEIDAFVYFAFNDDVCRFSRNGKFK